MCVCVVQTGDKEIKRDPFKAIEPLQTACESGEVVSCRNLTVLYGGADSVPADPEKAKYYRSRTADHIEAQTGTKLDRD